MVSNPDTFNICEAASFLGSHEQTVRKLARNGAIPCFKVGRDCRFRREAILRWSKEQQHEEGQYSVLVIDDEERVCHAMRRTLERFGCRVRLATDGMEGLHLVHKETLDLKMPDMSGPQFLEELRKTYPALPVVIVDRLPEQRYDEAGACCMRRSCYFRSRSMLSSSNEQ
jgi:excisionase family DNA binding protein